jgi:hypothetical protein
MILGIFSDLFEQVLVDVVLKCGMLATSFRNCVTACHEVPNIFQLQFEDSGNGSGGGLLIFASRESVWIEDPVQAKVCVRKLVGDSQIAVNFPCHSWIIRGRVTSRDIAAAGEFDRAMSAKRDRKTSVAVPFWVSNRAPTNAHILLQINKSYS